MRGELGEVLRRGVWVDDPIAGHAREADVRHRRERQAVAAHLAQRGEGRLDSCAVVRADRGHAELAQALRGLFGRKAREGLGARVEGEHREDRERSDAADAADRGLELLELEERLDGEEVDAAAFEDRGLLGEDLRALGGGDAAAGLAERPDRAGDEDVAARDLPCLARELDCAAVDRMELVLEVAGGELGAVCAERVRFDHVRSRLDEADVELDDRLRCPQVRLFGNPHAGRGARDEDAHAAVGHERRAVGEPFDEAIGHRRSLLPASGRESSLALSGHRGHLHRSRR